MKTKLQAVADYQSKCEVAESGYVALREALGRQIQKSMELKRAIANLELKFEQAIAEYGEELGSIEENFKER